MTPKEHIEAWQQKHRVTLSAYYIRPHDRKPERLAKGEKPRQYLQWQVDFLTDDRKRFDLIYSAGKGYCPSYRQRPSVDDQEEIDFEIATGNRATRRGSLGIVPGKPILPDPCDVLYSLGREAESVLDSGGFEDWADELGYNPDSRQAEEVYRLSLEQSLKLRAAIGPSALDELIEACRDY